MEPGLVLIFVGPPSSKILARLKLENRGTLALASTISVDSNATLENSGLFVVDGAAIIDTVTNGTVSSFQNSNSGTVDIRPVGTFRVDIPIQNSGLMKLLQGSLVLSQFIQVLLCFSSSGNN